MVGGKLEDTEPLLCRGDEVQLTLGEDHTNGRLRAMRVTLIRSYKQKRDAEEVAK